MSPEIAIARLRARPSDRPPSRRELWSDAATRVAGSLSAAGAGGGVGGDAEVSSKGLLDYTGSASLAGSRFGTLLLDPHDVTISTGANSNQTGFAAAGASGRRL